MNFSFENDINIDLHNIIRFVVESKIKYSFLFTPLIYSDINKCMKYLINKSLRIEMERPFELEYMEKILSLVVKSSLNLESVINGVDIAKEELILKQLENVLDIL